MERLPRFKCEFGYATTYDNKILFGKTDKNIVAYKELEFFLRVISPLSSREWLSIVKNLKRGMSFKFQFKEVVEENNVLKYLKVTRI